MLLLLFFCTVTCFEKLKLIGISVFTQKKKKNVPEKLHWDTLRSQVLETFLTRIGNVVQKNIINHLQLIDYFMG